jgi:hypothetical protein
MFQTRSPGTPGFRILSRARQGCEWDETAAARFLTSKLKAIGSEHPRGRSKEGSNPETLRGRRGWRRTGEDQERKRAFAYIRERAPGRRPTLANPCYSPVMPDEVRKGNLCNQCGLELMEVDNRGERLIGCLTCNLWASGAGKNWTRLNEEDLRSLHQMRHMTKRPRNRGRGHKSH